MEQPVRVHLGPLCDVDQRARGLGTGLPSERMHYAERAEIERCRELPAEERAVVELGARHVGSVEHEAVQLQARARIAAPVLAGSLRGWPAERHDRAARVAHDRSLQSLGIYPDGGE